MNNVLEQATDINRDDEVSSAPDLESLSAHGRIAWAADRFGEALVLSTSFGIQSAVMLHLLSETVPGIPVVFVDTGYHFPETYRFAEQLRERLKLNLRVYSADRSAAYQEAIYGKLWEKDLAGLDEYNRINKIEPMDRAIREIGAKAWFSGLRRTQSSTRRERPVAEKQNRMWKVYPIIDWSDRDVYEYLQKNDLPYHPLWEQGYVSVGDWHSTQRLVDGMSAEDTRFGGLKRECGLHENVNRPDYQI
jgi:phosphoadenosine phosphosulfate reductase